MADQTLKFILDVTYNGAEIKQFKVDLAGVVDKAKGAESALVKTGNGFVSLSGASKNAVSALDGLGISTVALTDPMFALGSAVKYSIEQAAEQQKVMAQTEAVIKSTGGAAGLTADEIANMAQSLSYTSTFADDAIQKGENLLLTFTNIGGDVFPEATQAMLDMATAMGTDASSGAIQLGKALNDPVAGISALSRVGVTFTDDQKKVIKTMVEMGDVAGAQKIILAELNKEFGGSAAAAADTYAGRMARLQNALDGLAESAATAPIAGRGLIDWLSDAAEAATTLLTMTQRINAALAEHADEVQDTAGSYEDYATELKRAADAAGYSVNAQGDLTQVVITTSGAYEKVIQQGYLLAQSEYDAAKAADAVAEAQAQAAQSSQELALADEEAIAKAQAKAQQMVLNAALSGTLTEAQNSYKDKVAESNATVAELTAELAKLTAEQVANGGSSEENAAKISDLNLRIAEAKQNATDANVEMHKLTNEFIFQKAAADLDAGAALELARQLGLVDEKSYAAASKVQELRNKYDTNKDGAISAAEAAKGYTAAVAALAQQINGLQDKTVTVRYVSEGTAAYQDATGSGRASGGPVESGRVYQVNESPGVGPEYFVSGVNGYMLNQSQAQAAMAGKFGGGGSALTFNAPVTFVVEGAAGMSPEALYRQMMTQLPP